MRNYHIGQVFRLTEPHFRPSHKTTDGRRLPLHTFDRGDKVAIVEFEERRTGRKPIFAICDTDNLVGDIMPAILDEVVGARYAPRIEVDGMPRRAHLMGGRVDDDLPTRKSPLPFDALTPEQQQERRERIKIAHEKRDFEKWCMFAERYGASHNRIKNLTGITPDFNQLQTIKREEVTMTQPVQPVDNSKTTNVNNTSADAKVIKEAGLHSKELMDTNLKVIKEINTAVMDAKAEIGKAREAGVKARIDAEIQTASAEQVLATAKHRAEIFTEITEPMQNTYERRINELESSNRILSTALAKSNTKISKQRSVRMLEIGDVVADKDLQIASQSHTIRHLQEDAMRVEERHTADLKRLSEEMGAKVAEQAQEYKDQYDADLADAKQQHRDKVEQHRDVQFNRLSTLKAEMFEKRRELEDTFRKELELAEDAHNATLHEVVDMSAKSKRRVQILEDQVAQMKLVADVQAESTDITSVANALAYIADYAKDANIPVAEKEALENATKRVAQKSLETQGKVVVYKKKLSFLERLLEAIS